MLLQHQQNAAFRHVVIKFDNNELKSAHSAYFARDCGTNLEWDVGVMMNMRRDEIKSSSEWEKQEADTLLYRKHRNQLQNEL